MRTIQICMPTRRAFRIVEPLREVHFKEKSTMVLDIDPKNRLTICTIN